VGAIPGDPVEMIARCEGLSDGHTGCLTNG